jgi:hypothetical protein
VTARDYEDHPIVKLFTDPGEFFERLRDALSDLIAHVLPWLVLLAVLTAIPVVALGAARKLRTARLSEGARRIRIQPPPDAFAEGALTLWMGLHAILRPLWRRMVSGQPHLCWEVVAEADAIEIFLWVPRAVPPGLIERAVESAWPGARTEPADGVGILPEGDAVATTDLALAQPEWFPIGEAPDTEPLRLALGTMTGLEAGERAVIQILARPATSAARFRLLRAARKLRRTAPALPFWAAAQGGATARTARAPLDPTVEPDVRAILQKAASPLWRCGVRVAVSSVDRPRARGKIHALAGAFAVFEGRNGFRRRRAIGGLQRLEGRVLRRGYLLSVPELAQVAALPAEPVPGLECARARTLAPPRALPCVGRVLGRADHPGSSRPVAISVEDARHHMHVVGETGTGKSTLIAQMVLDDAAAGRSAVVIDPKGDLVEAILTRLPKEAIDKTCLLDPDDSERAVGLNVLTGDNPDLVVDHVVGVFKRIYEPWWGPRTDDIMRAVCLTLTSIPGATLTEVPLLLSHEGWRREVRMRLDHSPGLSAFWLWYERLGEQQRAAMVAPLMNKLRAFLLRGPVRAIIGQAKPRLDIHSALDDGGLLLVRIPKGTLGEDTSRLLGALTVARVWQACMRRASAAESDRADTTLYVDEMHNYLALPRSFEDLLAEARGYRLSLVLAHQHMNQLPRDMREALAANARTKLVFACAPEDARDLERHFIPHLSAHDLQNLSAFQAACRPCLDAGRGGAFTFRTQPLPDPEDPDRAGAVRTRSSTRFGRARSTVEGEIRNRHRIAGTRLLPRKPDQNGGANR